MKNKEITWNGQALLKVDMEEDVAEMEKWWSPVTRKSKKRE